jgi:hypothetical protein
MGAVDALVHPEKDGSCQAPPWTRVAIFEKRPEFRFAPREVVGSEFRFRKAHPQWSSVTERENGFLDARFWPQEASIRKKSSRCFASSKERSFCLAMLSTRCRVFLQNAQAVFLQ